jgi:hypothetical protein
MGLTVKEFTEPWSLQGVSVIDRLPVGDLFDSV